MFEGELAEKSVTHKFESSELLWVASAALCAQLPAGWREAVGGDGMPYYFHPGLGHVMHEHPAHCHWRGVAFFLLEE